MENARKTTIFFDIKKCYTCNVTFQKNTAAAGYSSRICSGVSENIAKILI